MSDFLSVTMWRAMFEIADRGCTSNVVTRRTLDALVGRALIQHGSAGRWQLTTRGRKMVDRVVQFDVT